MGKQKKIIELKFQYLRAYLSSLFMILRLHSLPKPHNKFFSVRRTGDQGVHEISSKFQMERNSFSSLIPQLSLGNEKFFPYFMSVTGGTKTTND